MKPAANRPSAADAGEEGLFDLFASRVFTVRLLVLTCALLLLAAAVGPVLTLYLVHEPERVALVNEDGTVTIARLQRFKEALAFPKMTANQAALAMLDRTVTGIDDGDTVDLLFNRAAKDRLADLVKSQDSVFKEYGYHQKAEIASTEVVADPDGTYRAKVEGQLIRTGVFNEAPKLDRLNFTVIVHLFRNENAAFNRQYPLGVWSFDYRESR